MYGLWRRVPKRSNDFDEGHMAGEMVRCLRWGNSKGGVQVFGVVPCLSSCMGFRVGPAKKNQREIRMHFPFR